MALVKCPECGKEVSDKAVSCIQCGFPLGGNHEGVLMIKAQKYPDHYPNTSREIGIYTTDGAKIATLYSGSAISIDICNDIEVYAKLEKMALVKHSNTMLIKSNTTTRIMISYQLTMFSTKVIISAVDIIDSE